jgi:hypothetical protein
MSLKSLQYRKTNHIGHAILSLIFPPWIIVWVVCAVNNSNYNNHLDVIHAIKNKDE